MCVTVTRTPNKKLQMSLTMAPVTRRKRKETASGVERNGNEMGKDEIRKQK